MAKYFYGCIKQKYDVRDWKYSLSAPVASRPPVVDLRPKCPPVYDQGQLGSCTGNGIAGDIEFLQKNFHGTEFTPSRLFIYYCERFVEGTISQDAGAEIRDGIKCVSKYGAPPESVWPYNIKKFATKPTVLAYQEALDCLAVQYEAVQNLNGICDAIALQLPVVIGITVYDSFESDIVAKTGIVPVPNKATEQIQGGHCVVIVGYDDTKRSRCSRPRPTPP